MPVSEKPRGVPFPKMVIKRVKTTDGKIADVVVGSHMPGKRLGKNSHPNDFGGRRRITYTSPVRS